MHGTISISISISIVYSKWLSKWSQNIHANANNSAKVAGQSVSKEMKRSTKCHNVFSPVSFLFDLIV